MRFGDVGVYVYVIGSRVFREGEEGGWDGMGWVCEVCEVYGFVVLWFCDSVADTRTVNPSKSNIEIYTAPEFSNLSNPSPFLLTYR